MSGPQQQIREWTSLQARADDYPEPLRDMAGRGLRKVVDFQDLAYGREYLDRLDRAVAADDAGHGYGLSLAAAKHVANAMCYDDVIRVADLKTRSSRGARVRRDVGVASDAVLHVTEYFHPRIEEFCGTMPARLGRWIEAARAYALARGGREVAARQLLEMLESSPAGSTLAYQIAIVHAALGDRDAAFSWLRKAVERRTSGCTSLKVDPRLDPLRTDDRFQSLLQAVGLAEKAN